MSLLSVKLNIRFLVISIFFLFCANLTAQELISYTTKQGLPSNYIYDIVQDSNGFMWFATNRGVVKFDGVSFKTFTVKDGLPNNDTWKLETDLDGKVWYFSKSNYQGYIQNDSIYKFITPDSVVINPKNISKSKGKIWMDIGSFQNVHLKDNKYEKGTLLDYPKLDDFMRNQFGLKQSPRRKYFATINPELGHNIIIYNSELLVLDIDLNILYRKKHDLINMSKGLNLSNKVGSLLNHSYFVTMSKGVLFINHKTNSSKYYSYKELFGQEKILEIYVKTSLEEIQVSVKGHLLRFNYDFELIDNIFFSQSIPNHKSYRDFDGNIWLIDLGKGITFQPNTQIENRYYLLEKNIQKIGLIKESLFVGILNEGFFEYLTPKNTFVNRINQKNGKIYQISYSKNSKQGYLSSNLPPPIIYKNNLFDRHYFNKVEVAKYLVEFNGFLYFLSSGNLSKKNLKTGEEFVVQKKQGLIIGEVHQNTLYIGASDGLHILKKDSLIRPKIRGELLKTPILSLLSTKNHLIVGTDGRGIYLLSNDKIINLKNTEDLSIQRIIKKEHVLWLSTQKGVFKVKLDSNNIANSKIIDAYFEEDGLLQNNTNDIHIDKNNLYVASDIGLTKLDLNNPNYQKKPKLYFKAGQDTLKFKGSERENISIAFSVMDYTDQENYNFEYRLLPNQTDWFSTTTQTVNFSNLAPNFYTLEVKAKDHHGNQIIKNQYIEIIPTWYQTVWAKFGFAILSLFLLGGLIKIIQLRIRKKEQDRAQQEKRIAGLELQALRSQMNPHFVHNSLNAILYYIQRSEKELSEKYIVKFSKLIRLFFEYSRKQNITVNKEVGLLNNYLQVEQLRFEDKLQYKITVDEKIDEEEYQIPSMILQPIVENAVNHGLFHKSGIGTVLVNFTYLNDLTYKVTVKDDGIGIHKSKDIFNKSSKNYQSRSSTVLSERLALLKQSKEWDITYEIEDLSTNSEISGTMVTLIFKQSNN